MKGSTTMGIAILMLSGIVAVPAVSADTVSHDLFDGLLKKYVKHGAVDYSGFKREAATLEKYLKILETAKPDSLPRNERFAFYINAYNAWTIKLILSKYPDVTSIKDLGGLFSSPWKKKICRLNGTVITLDDIEHGILRPQFQDPRVHFAINCASKSCPALRSVAYQGARLDQQLNAAASDFLNDPTKNYLEGDTLYVSKIFDWFGEDFQNDVPGFFRLHAKGDLKAALQQAGSKLRIRYVDYDWSLNGF